MQALLVALCCGVVFGFDPAGYAHHQGIDELGINYTVHWKTDATNIYLALTAQSTGWLGFGIGEQTVGSMPGADIVVGWVAGGVGTVKDKYALGKYEPIDDPNQDWILVAAEETGGMTALEMKRALNTGDPNDRPIVTDKTMFVIAAYGATDNFAQHVNRIATAIHFGTGVIPDPLASIRGNPNIGYFDVRQDFVLTSAGTVYQLSDMSNAGQCYDFAPQCPTIVANPGCSGMVPTNGGQTQQVVSDLCPKSCGCVQNATNSVPLYVIAMEVITTPDTASHVHHIVLKGYDTGAGGAQVDLWATAHGSSAFILPDACHYLFNITNGIVLPYLQTHYDNSAGTDVNKRDQSGVRLYYQLTPRSVQCGMISLGDPDVRLGGQSITGLTQTRFLCNSTCTQQLPFSLNVFGSLLHMHGWGKHMYTEQFRGGNLVRITNHVDFYDSGFQRLVPLNYTIEAGDELRTTCIHQTSSPVQWGISTQQEMCMEFVYYYPKLPGVSKCGYPEPGYGANQPVCGAYLGEQTLTADVITSFGIGGTPTKTQTSAAWVVLPGMWAVGLSLVM